MKRIKHVSFDLDGTLVNSYNTIYKSTLKTLEYLKIPCEVIEAEFQQRIGYHFADIFKELSIPVTDIEHFITLYKSFYFDFIKDSELYPSAEKTIKKLYEKDVKISLLTTKAQDQADKIIDHFNLRKYFSFIMGRRPELAHKPSPESLLFICKEINIKPEETLMVGDTELDINCAKNANALSCAVTYGYRSEEVLKKEGPDFIISDLNKLLKLEIFWNS